MNRLSLLFGLFFTLGLSAQTFKCGTLSPEARERLKRDMEFLASDDLQGRLPGTEGANEAVAYIIRNFQEAGLRPFFPGGFTQQFSAPRPAHLPKQGNWIRIQDDSLFVNSGTTAAPAFVLLPYSQSSALEGSSVYIHAGIQGVHYQGTSLLGQIVTMDWELSPKDQKKYSGQTSLSSRIQNAKQAGAKAIILLDRKNKKGITQMMLRRQRDLGIPVALVSGKRWVRKLRRAQKDVGLQITIQERGAEAYNVAGFLDLGQPTTIVVGAHYDHVGLGKWGSRNPDAEGQVHNGADDNASGTAVLMELAREVSLYPEVQGRNILFVAFSAEEDGLLGSKYFVENCPVPVHDFAYMLNIDMVGRLNRADSLMIYATGSAAEWASVLRDMPCDQFGIENIPALFPRSDHAPFVRAGIPAIMLHTGLHEDYHGPTDDLDKIDMDGLVKVTEAALEILERAQKHPRLTFIDIAQRSERVQ
jgi:Iap family predicted aminopeptidase